MYRIEIASLDGNGEIEILWAKNDTELTDIILKQGYAGYIIVKVERNGWF